MFRLTILFFIAIVMMEFSPLDSNAQETGAITGNVRSSEQKAELPSINVKLKGTTLGAVTDFSGNFFISKIPAGTYTLVISAIGYETLELDDLAIHGGDTIRKSIFINSAVVQMNDVTVYGAALRAQRVMDAPAATLVLQPGEIARNSGHGQLPKLLAGEPGVDVVQSGLFDFNLNSRGFNSSLSRRLLVLIDGRDLAIALLGAQEWNGLSVPLEDLGSIEMVRGPGSALYGANAYNGVVNISTPPPNAITGTKATITYGERSSWRADARYAAIRERWSYKANIGHFQGLSWSAPRPDTLAPPVFANGEFEYNGLSKLLNTEVKSLDQSPVQSTYGSLRIDYDYINNAYSTIEAGTAEVQNEVYVTGIGRVQVTKAIKPWGRIGYYGNNISTQFWISGRKSLEPQYSLSTGLPLHEESRIMQAEAHYHFSPFSSLFLVTVGASQRWTALDTKGTLLLNEHDDNATGIFGQVEYNFNQKIRGLFAARWDRSSLHPEQFSPKAAIVWSPSQEHTVRATYNRAFQAPSYIELFLNIKHPFRNYAYFGNKNLDVEKISGYELGYKGIFNYNFFLTTDFYFNHLTDFITDLAGGVNPAYPLEPVHLPGDTRPQRSILSYGNAGSVDEYGIEIGANYYLTDEWILDGNYSLFKFEILSKDARDALLPNAPEYRINGGVTYRNRSTYEVSVKTKYVPSFRWAAGVYEGDILAYTLFDLSGSYQLSTNIQARLTISNIFDRVHYEMFGGSLIGRYALISLTTSF